MERRKLLQGTVAGLLTPSLARANNNVDEEEVKALLGRLAAAVRGKHVDRIMECFLPDGILIAFDVSGNFRSPAEVRKAFKEFLATIPGPVHFELNDLGITCSATVAYAHCFEHLRATNNMGKTMDVTVRNTRGLRKVKGKWLIAHEHASMPVDLATGRIKVASNS